MHHLMRHDILLVPLVTKMVGAQQYPKVLTERSSPRPGSTERIASPTRDVLVVKRASNLLDTVSHEAYDGRIREKPVAVLLATGTVGVFVHEGFGVDVLFGFRGRGGVREDGEETRPGVPCRIVLLL